MAFVKNKIKLSVVVCVYNEEKNIAPLFYQLQHSLDEFNYEIIFVDDGSTDNTVCEIKNLLERNVHLIELTRNFGQSTALAAGIDFASGNLICTIDGDLQNDPEDIPVLVNAMLSSHLDIVAGIRSNRQDGFFLRKLPSNIANFFIRKFTGVYMKDYGCTLKVFRKEIAKNLGLYGELHRFIPVLACIQGARMAQVEVRHHPRIHGRSKYGINRTLKVMADLILMVFFQKYMSRPMHLFGISGLIIFTLGMLLNLYLFAQKILGEAIWGKPMLILAVVLTLGGIQLITTGILAEILMRTYYESQKKKTYAVRHISTVPENSKSAVVLN
jgi:glycosyltransferase involved in cell wall biosynthesis